MSMTTALSHDDLLSPAAVSNPYPLYAHLRETDPVHWNPLFEAWVVTRYDDVLALLQDPRVVSGWGLSRPVQVQTPEDEAALKALIRFRDQSIAGMEGADHRRLRALVLKAFTPGMLVGSSGFIQTLVDNLIDQALPRGQIEVMHELAMRLPAKVIFHLCGVPEEMHDDIIRSANIMATSAGLSDLAPGELAALAREGFAVMDRLNDLIDQRAANPQEGLISQLVQAKENDHALSREELCMLIYGLLLGGYETTARLITNGILALVRHPDQAALLRNNPELGESAVEEVLRFDSPLLLNFRTPNEEIVVRGQTIKPGELMLLSLGAANHDPAQFPDPDRFDITRQPNRHLAFGYGAHYCFGAPLARLEARIVFETVLRRLPDLRMAETELEWAANFLMRDLKALPLLFSRQH